jgi:hypothetical protein
MISGMSSTRLDNAGTTAAALDTTLSIEVHMKEFKAELRQEFATKAEFNSDHTTPSYRVCSVIRH